MLVDVFLHGSGGRANPEHQGEVVSIGLGVSGMVELDSAWQVGMTYGADAANVFLIPNDPTLRQTFLPEVGYRVFGNGFCSLTGRLGLGLEHWTTDYSQDDLGPSKPENSYTVSHLEPVIALAFNEQVFYRWLGFSLTQRVRANRVGAEKGMMLGVLLRL